MFTLAHLSDWHLASAPQPAELIGKRGLGFINWHRARKDVHRPEVLNATIRDLKSSAPDHIAVTGDLTNFSLADEYRRARFCLETLGPPHDVTVVPGNHDTYVRGAAQAPAAHWADYMLGDGVAAQNENTSGESGAVRFPFVRRRGDLALIALSTAVPTAPLLATGRLGSRQLRALAKALDEHSASFRVVLIHHPAVTPWQRRLRRLTDASRLRKVLADHGAELLLHGHDHARTVLWLEGLHREIPAVGVPSASARIPHGDEDTAGYNLFRIDGEPGKWRCQLIARQRGADGTFADAERRELDPSMA